jgi:hypothetical protein
MRGAELPAKTILEFYGNWQDRIVLPEGLTKKIRTILSEETDG